MEREEKIKEIEKILVDSRSSYDLTKQVEQLKELFSLTSSNKQDE